MRIFALLACIAAAFVPAFSQEADAEKKLASVGGKIVNSLTGEPLRKAAVTLVLIPAGGVGVNTSPQTQSTTSDAEGKFLFERIEPGRYGLSAEKVGFGQQRYGSSGSNPMASGTHLTVGAGDKLTSLDFRMTPQAVIIGRVVDEDGEPVTRAMVQALRQTSLARSPVGISGNPANDIGEFRIANLAPGKYILRADYRSMGEPPPSTQEASGIPRADYVPTFYPGGTDIAGVVPFELKAGQEMSGVVIRLQKSRVYRVAGKLVGVSPASARLSVMLQPQRRPGAGSYVSMMGANASLKPDGTFTFPSVQSGTYHVTAMNYGSGRPVTLGKTLVTISNQDVDNVVIQAGTPLTLTGTLIREGDETQEKLMAQVLVQSTEGVGFFGMPARTDDSGAFKIENVPRDKLSVFVMGISGDLYVSSIRAGSIDVLANGLDLTSAESAPPLEIRVSPNGASVEGSVANGDSPAAGAMVLLVPQPFRPEQPSMFQKMSTTDQTGHFRIQGVAPGEYRAYAFTEMVPLQNMEPDELKVIEPRSVSIRTKEKSREQVELKLITAVAR
jgi:hypothetical protein